MTAARESGPAPGGGTRVTIVMYHYVRPLEGSRYPRLRALPLAAFRGQLDYIARHHEVIGAPELIAAVRGGPALPPNALLLTFDDGYTDHATHVLPELERRGWTGAFFPVAGAVTRRQMLDVNKLHFALAAAADPAPLAAEVRAAVLAHRARLGLDEPAAYEARCRGDSRYDSPDITFVKRMLQRELPAPLRAELTDTLFHRLVTRDEAAFADELYLSADQLRDMVGRGMYVGSHGDTHRWMNTLTRAEQAAEVDASLALLRAIGAPASDWIMCYPYGGYDASLLDVVRERGCAAGLAVRVGVADLASDDPLALPRLDTNDLPTTAAAEPVDWTRHA